MEVIMKKKGHRLILLDRYDVVLTAIFLFVSLLSPFAFGWSSFIKLSDSTKIWLGLSLLVGVSVVTLGLLIACYHWLSFFKSKRDNRLVLAYLLSNSYYETVHRRDGKGDKIKLPPVYVKKIDYATIAVTVEMAGKLMRDLDKIPSDLEKLFFADFKERNDFREHRLFSKHAYTQFIFSDNKEAQRLAISDLLYDKEKGIRLMDGEYWDFIHSPHLLIAGGTGSGKTIFLLALLKVLASFSLLEICDPKKSDLSVLDNFEVFKGHVHSEIEEIMDCLKNAVTFMDERYRQMGLNSEHPEDVKIGNNYQSYGLAPQFILIDEWTAFIASLDIRKASLVDDLMAQLILKGRQAGVFLIVAMQRPDAEYLSANLRDNMMARLSLGKLSKSGYRMIFGEDYEDKNYLYIKSKIGRGYAALDGGMPSEFFSPLIPFDKGFSFEEIFVKMKPLEAKGQKQTDTRLEASLEETLEETSEKLSTLSELAQSFQLSATTLTRVVHYLEEAGYEFTEETGHYNILDQDTLSEVIDYKKNHAKQNWKEAAQFIAQRN
jgi:DNA polymerase III delta prime subunit